MGYIYGGAKEGARALVREERLILLRFCMSTKIGGFQRLWRTNDESLVNGSSNRRTGSAGPVLSAVRLTVAGLERKFIRVFI